MIATANAPREIALTDALQELVIGLVAPLGTELDAIEAMLGEQVAVFGYTTKCIRLSELLAEGAVKGRHGVELKMGDEYARLCSFMDAGNALRRATSQNDILALYAASQILRARERDEEGNPRPSPQGKLHVLRSLKHPDEVEALRRIYGDGFYLLAVHSPESVRMRNLVQRKHLKQEQIKHLIERDTHESVRSGQQTRETFELGDVFIEHRGEEHHLLDDMRRVVELLFGSPYVTPTRDEHAMFMAYAASLRSASLSRQVGASIATREGDIVATGANDVPKSGGGQYWPEPGEKRDHVKGEDSNDVEKQKLAMGLLRALNRDGDGGLEDAQLLNKYASELKSSGLLDITEYGRDVHAEMEAIASCARNGRATRGCLLYTTTYPCHNCAKHIVAAGIDSVCFVEPYPKSRALDLHDDAIALSDAAEDQKKDKVVFRPFVGVGPRRYFDLFSLRLGSGRPLVRKLSGRVRGREDWGRMGPRVPLLGTSYLERERLATDSVADNILARGET